MTIVMDLAAAMGIALLTEEEYLALQKLGEFDTKTSSWIATPADFREKGARSGAAGVTAASSSVATARSRITRRGDFGW